MKVVIIGRHLEVTPALQSWVEQKAGYHKTSFRRERGGCELVDESVLDGRSEGE
jgi:ribosome-associated translation inhibitor RaiA